VLDFPRIFLSDGACRAWLDAEPGRIFGYLDAPLIVSTITASKLVLGNYSYGERDVWPTHLYKRMACIPRRRTDEPDSVSGGTLRRVHRFERWWDPRRPDRGYGVRTHRAGSAGHDCFPVSRRAGSTAERYTRAKSPAGAEPIDLLHGFSAHRFDPTLSPPLL